MAVKIRLARIGKTNQALYRVVVIDEHKQRNGQTIETVGSYDPHQTAGKLQINQARIDYWVSVGAKPTPTVANLLKTTKK